ncbi:MAG: methyltransferase domain-containing protein [Candidatus Omnitrophica bacterium]|nr:methyltransferase domain-containing protein [Candidatus Omnitrophota bacterium]
MPTPPKVSFADQKKSPARAVKTTLKSSCSVCGGVSLEKVLSLPGFPLTGVYVEKPCSGRFPDFDQELMLCRTCGHAQLSRVVDPDYLYVKTYSHRSSESLISIQGNDFFLGFLDRISDHRRFKSVLEVGCNDLYLLKKLRKKCSSGCGIDPIWRGKPPKSESGINVIGKFIEEVDLEKEMEERPDLVISAHTFEHMNDPRGSLEKLMRFASKEALFIVEVPGFESLLDGRRFDQVFHQHIQYFSVASFYRLIEDLGGNCLGHVFNKDYWGGTLLVAFCKKESVSGPEKSPRNFQAPTASFDNPARDGLAYPDLVPSIRRPWDGLNLQNAGVLITALDSARPILSRLRTLEAKKAINPLDFLQGDLS